MDQDIHFGQVEQPQPERRRRPDHDRQFESVGCGQMDDVELPIFVDLDVMRDMEGHARTNTQVELGGVLLGGKYVDEQGQPFVVVEQSLRAEHYEATRGSFKFTHDTWARITRDREDFPGDLKLVGWYHTHPDWGVFLSGMDLFICENFFADSLDVALVIDPCRGDRGWFHWSGPPGARTKQRTGGFHLFANRFRRSELLHFATALAEVNPAYHDSRYDGSFGGSDMQPVVHLHQQQSGLQMIALLGMLTIQILFVGLIAWRILFPPAPQPELAQQHRNEVYREVLGGLAADNAVGQRMVERVEDLGKANVELRTSVQGQAALIEKLQTQNLELQNRRDQLSSQLATVKRDNTRASRSLASLQEQLDAQSEGKPRNWLTWPLVAGMIVVTGLLGLIGGRLLGWARSADHADQPDLQTDPETGQRIRFEDPERGHE